MTNFEIVPYFGKIDLENSSQDEYHGDLLIRGRKVRIDLHFEEEKTKESVSVLKSFLANLDKIEAQVMEAIRKNFNSNGIVKEYCNWHLNILKIQKMNLISTMRSFHQWKKNCFQF